MSHPDRFLRLVILLGSMGFGMAAWPRPGLAEPRIVIGPTDPEEEPEIVETISGLSYDQLKRLRELRKWLEQRQMIREQIRLQQPGQRRLSDGDPLTVRRQLLAPLGQRYNGRLPGPPPPAPTALKLPPLPHFEDGPPITSRAEMPEAAEAMMDDSAGPDGGNERPPSPASRVTHIYPPPPPGAGEGPQVEYELRPEPCQPATDGCDRVDY